MKNDTGILPFRQSDSITDPLTELAREGARRMLAEALKAEADAFVASFADERLEDGRQRIVRHGFGPERYAAITWDNPAVEMRQLSLTDVVEQLAYDLLADTHGGWENYDGAYGEFCFDASARCIHLEFNERFTSSELFTHEF